MNTAQQKTLAAFARFQKFKKKHGVASKSEQAKAMRILENRERKARQEHEAQKRDADRRFKDQLQENLERQIYRRR